VSFTFDADDPRSIRALEIAAEADQWLSGRNSLGEEMFGVPSQRDPTHHYVVTASSCDCPDFSQAEQSDEQRACKHMLAVRLHCELVKAQQRRDAQRPSTSRRRGHLAIVS
jgi:hypothetical protein